MDELARNRYPGVDWKQDLRVSQHELAEHEKFGEGVASVCNAVERYVMRSALAFRKLLDRVVLTDEVKQIDWNLRAYPCTKPPETRYSFDGTIDLENLHHFVRHYDTDRLTKRTLRLQRLANLLIHNFVFVVWPPDPGKPYDAARFFFNSDFNKDEVVYEMTVTEFKQIVEEVLYDEVVYISQDRETGEIHQHNAAWRSRLYAA